MYIIYILFALQGNFSGFTKEYVIGSNRMFMKKLHFHFFFTFELLYSLTIES